MHPNKLKSTRDMTTLRTRIYTSRAIIYATILIFVTNVASIDGARIKRAVMLSMNDMSNPNCQSGTIVERNSSTSIVLTGTARKCDKSTGKYSCEVQIWRVMKGENLLDGLVTFEDNTLMAHSKISLVRITGLGNPAFCDSKVKVLKTRIFFLNRVDDKLVLAASLLHITLQNLENTQKVIKGIPVKEPPKEPKDPCMFILCGFGAKCQASANGTATCVCPPVTCGGESGSSDTFAPVCGSDGVTYPSECRVKAAQCWTQQRIRIVSERPCSPVEVVDPCKEVRCGNAARCAVIDGKAKCQCRSCDRVSTHPVCGSDQVSYRTECDLHRASCMTARTLYVVRRSACDPCQMYNEATRTFEKKCHGACGLDDEGNPQCCDSIECSEDDELMVCGSDGRTYGSKCALSRYACKTGKIITIVAEGSCPTPKDTTTIRGSTSIASDANCPGNCDITSPEFIGFKKDFVKLVNEKLEEQNNEDIDARTLSQFKVEEVRHGSAVLVYSVVMVWSDIPIYENFIPGEDWLWAFMRLHDPANGALTQAMDKFGATLANSEPGDNFLVEEVCGPLQCENGAGCLTSKDAMGGFQYACDCSVLGEPERLPVTLGCRMANNHRFYENKVAALHASCMMKKFFTFKDICREQKENPCSDVSCPNDGSICIITNGEAACECMSCSEEFEPVCGSNDRTYRSECQLSRDNCLHNSAITVKSKGMCSSQCDEVDCRNGQCVELSQGSATCTCPSVCVDVHSPVCGSDGKTYDNECQLTIAACTKKNPITVVGRKPCDDISTMPIEPNFEGSGDSIEGSGADECGCGFGAVCDTTIDDEDRRCVCNLKCESFGEEVCGSDEKTYANACELSKAACEAQKMIYIVSEGKCSSSCHLSPYGCCKDNVTTALGTAQSGCPEFCKCNEHGSFSRTCHPSSKQCDCRPGVGGLRCDQCQPGFWNFRAIAEKGAVGCMECKCHKDGSVRDDCDQMTGQCVCKDGIIGVKCSLCAETRQWVTASGCGEGSDNIETARSCDELNCRYGQECVADHTGNGFMCQCPALSSCDGYSNGKVCGSNGITYADECQMMIVACREGLVITVQSNGTCKEFFKSLKPVVPPLVTLTSSPAPTTSTTTMKTTTTTTAAPPTTITSSTTTTVATTTSTVIVTTSTAQTPTPAKEIVTPDPDFDIDIEGSGNVDMNKESTEDDEDKDMEGSGEDLDLGPDHLTLPESDKTLQATMILSSAGAHDNLVFSPDLRSKDTELYAEYRAAIGTKIAQILYRIPAENGRLKELSDLEFKDSNIKGIEMVFKIRLTDGAHLNEVQQFVEANLKEGESFSFLEPAHPPIGVPTLPYVEDGEWNRPQFGGSSFMEFEKMSAFNAVTIHMKFRTSDSEGLLLYNGQKDEKDFISLAVIGGFVEFRFDTGSGQLSLRSTIPVNDGNWHVVVSRRNRREGMLKVDSETEISGYSISGTAGLNIDTSLYIGGVDHSKHDIVFKQTGVKKGLTGCISQVKVGEHGNKTLRISSIDNEALSTYRIAECAPSPCLPSPCQNSGKCFITYQLAEFTFKCDCGPLYYGEKCQSRTIAEACSSNPCHESSTCVEEEDSYRCECPHSRQCVHCDKMIEDLQLPTDMEPSYMPMFAGDSYIERPTLSGVSTKFEVEIVFYIFQLEGLLFYNGQKPGGKGDFVALNIREGYLEFMYDLGAGPAIIRSEAKVTMNKWHTARLSRYGKLGDMTLDDGPTIKGESAHSHSQLNLEQPLYIGALPEGVEVPGITTGLMGSIQKFVVNGVTFPRSLKTANSKSYNVQAFNGHACFHKPCHNEGVCVPNLGLFTCNCKAGYSGELCEDADETDSPMLQDSSEFAVYFDGNVHAEYKNHITRRENSFKDNYFELQLKTTVSHGLIFYDGKPTRRGDYIALAVNNGQLHLTFDLGSGPAHIVSDEVVNNDQWRTVKIVRNEHRASLQVDQNKPKYNSAPPLTKWLNTVGTLWIGGCDTEHLPPRHRGVPRAFYIGFEGCLRQFHVADNLLHLRKDLLNSANLQTCQNR